MHAARFDLSREACLLGLDLFPVNIGSGRLHIFPRGELRGDGGIRQDDSIPVRNKRGDMTARTGLSESR